MHVTCYRLWSPSFAIHSYVTGLLVFCLCADMTVCCDDVWTPHNIGYILFLCKKQNPLQENKKLQRVGIGDGDDDEKWSKRCLFKKKKKCFICCKGMWLIIIIAAVIIIIIYLYNLYFNTFTVIAVIFIVCYADWASITIKQGLCPFHILGMPASSLKYSYCICVYVYVYLCCAALLCATIDSSCEKDKTLFFSWVGSDQGRKNIINL